MTSLIILDKGGESIILIRNCAGETLAEMMFTLCSHEGNSMLSIDKLQGGGRLLPREETQKAIKSCYGIFPKRIVMGATCCFAEQLSIEQILAVNSGQHIFHSLRYDNKDKIILSDYSTFWEPIGGGYGGNGYYHIPHTLARKSEADTASKGHAEYRRRYQLLDGTHSRLSSTFRH